MCYAMRFNTKALRKPTRCGSLVHSDPLCVFSSRYPTYQQCVAGEESRLPVVGFGVSMRVFASMQVNECTRDTDGARECIVCRMRVCDCVRACVCAGELACVCMYVCVCVCVCVFACACRQLIWAWMQ